MQFSWRFHAGSMENCCRFHAGSMCVLKVLPCWFVLSCTLTDAGSMEVPWRFQAGSMENCCRFHAGSMCVLKALPLSALVGFIMYSD